MGVKVEDLLDGVLTQGEISFVDGLRIPYNDNTGLWTQLMMVQRKVAKALESGMVSKVSYEPVTKQAGPHVISDYTGGGIDGIKSMADGKYYDSKSEYRKELKRRGLVELGNDAPVKGKGPEAHISDRELKQDIAQAISQLGG